MHHSPHGSLCLLKMGFWCGLSTLVSVQLAPSALGQSLIVPDDTLGAEASQVIQNFNGTPNEVITGGAQRAQNLFHSFEEFNVDEGRGAYFFSPDGVNNIFSRVTGNNPSNILGVLGTFGGNADLFFMNPNGILFGPNSSLDVEGSFTATTADAIQFSEAGFFSADNPEIPSELLTINPSAFLFNQIPAGNINITAQSFLLPGIEENITLLGGDIVIEEGGSIAAAAGNINIAGLTGAGIVELHADGQLILPQEAQRSTILLSNGNALTLNGSIYIQGNIAELDNSFISSVPSENFSGTAGDITIDASNLTLSNSQITASADGTRSSGAIALRVDEEIQLLSNSIVAASTFGAGAGGDISIETGTLRVVSDFLDLTTNSNASFIQSATTGDGDAGSISIRATDAIYLDGGSVTATTRNAASGNAGDIDIETQYLQLIDGALITTDTLEDGTTGNAGNIFIRATDAIEISGIPPTDPNGFDVLPRPGEITSSSLTESQGNSGDVVLETGRLTIQDGGKVGADVLGGFGNAGNVTVRADDIELSGFSTSSEGDAPLFSAISISVISTNPEVQGGTLAIEAQRLRLSDGAQVNASLSGFGEAGDIQIQSNEIELVGSVNNSASGIFSGIGQGSQGTGGSIDIEAQRLTILDRARITASTLGTGDAGDVVIQTGQLNLKNGGTISTETQGVGDAGDVMIRADQIQLFGSTASNPPSTTISTAVGATARGTAGDITIEANRLVVENGAFIQTFTAGEGDAGNLTIAASNIRLSGINAMNASALITLVDPDAVGNSGNVQIEAERLIIEDGGLVRTDTFGNGGAGDITIMADNIRLSGFTDQTGSSGLFATVQETGIEDGGTIRIDTDRLTIENGAQIGATTFGQGNAGDVRINASEQVIIDGVSQLSSSGIFARTRNNATGQAGIIVLNTDMLRVSNGAVLTVQTRNERPGGNISVNASDIELIDGGQLISTTLGDGRAGNIIIDAEQITLSGSDPTFAARQEESNERASEDPNLRGIFANEDNGQSGLFASTSPDSSGNGGRIRINATDLTLQDEATISTQTEGEGNGGSIILNVLGNLEMGDRAQITSTTNGQGDAGDIQLFVTDGLLLSRGSISSRVGAAAAGVGGDIVIQAGQLTLRDRSLISAQSDQRLEDIGVGTLQVSTPRSIQGNAGNILIVIDRGLILENSDITTQAVAFAGGAIDIQAGTIRLLGDGDITTNVQSGTAGGGNITLAADSIIAFGDSDILAFAADGRGGNITLDTPAFFGENFDLEASATDPVSTLDGNDRVDINASGAVAGVITLPDVSFIQNSLNDLPEGVINTESLIANSCVVQNEDGSSTFIVTGAGGLPLRPGDTYSTYSTGDVQPVADDTSTVETNWQVGDPIVEPQGVYQLPNGELVLSHACR